MDTTDAKEKKCRKFFSTLLFLIHEKTHIVTSGMLMRTVLKRTPQCDEYADFDLARKSYWDALRSGPPGISHRIASEDFELTCADEKFIKSLPDKVHNQTRYAVLDAVGAIPPADGLLAMKEMSDFLDAEDKTLIERLL
jgi:hypothetical protein